MPPKTRAIKSTKLSKENITTKTNNKNKTSSKVTKASRKPLADKTNSASDDNATILPHKKKIGKKLSIEDQHKADTSLERPRRARRVPTRFKENNVLNNLSNASISPSNKVSSEEKNYSSKQKEVIVKLSPIKTPLRHLDSSLVKNRPKRICRLPSKFDDHSVSPNKFIPVQPINASTPLANKTTKSVSKDNATITIESKADKTPPSSHNEVLSKRRVPKQKDGNVIINNKNQADTNNNAKQTKKKLVDLPSKSPEKKFVNKAIAKKPLPSANFSIRLLDDKKKCLKRDSSKLDIYEFTFDPEEEPPPAKKKKKKPTTKKPSKPKTVTIKSNYDKNLAKALATLKNTVAQKNTQVPNLHNEPGTSQQNANNQNESVAIERNYNSVRVEDIALDMQDSLDHDINYSPINSPNRPKTPVDIPPIQSPERPIAEDPLNLRDDISFFDDQPVASSSMNMSVKHPLASPWRVEFNNLPIKWQANTHLKANMTPAIECSFMDFNDSKKKHVYANIVPEHNETLPQIIQSTPNFKQTSIISFIKEVVDKSEAKKRKVKATPVKGNSLFEDITNSSAVYETPQKRQSNENSVNNSVTPNKDIQNSNNTSLSTDDKENSGEQEHKNNSTESSSSKKKSSTKRKNKDNTYFGFDDSEDQENVSPAKKNKARALRPRSRAVLQEINSLKGPIRAIIPVAVKSKPVQSSDTVNKLYDMKSATEPPVFPEMAVTGNTEIAKDMEPTVPEYLENDDSQSVHLFEDIELIHHLKPNRKSYTKTKRMVTFQQKTGRDSDDSPPNDVVDHRASSDEDNLDDLSFHLPTEKVKKTIKRKKPKKQLSKKEARELEAWAAGFNSMCEDIDEVDLVVE